jgi:RNA polymerase sigma-70 factor (sigma-E family)
VDRAGSIAERAIGILEPSRARLDRLAEWFVGSYRPLLRFAHVLTGDPAAAEDLVQDTFVRLYRADRRIDEAGFLAYARRTMLNLARSRLRRLRLERRARAARVEQAPPPEPPDEVWRAILALPHGQRAVVALRFYEDLSEQEIARALDVTPGTVKKQMHRALARLRRTLGEEVEP